MSRSGYKSDKDVIPAEKTFNFSFFFIEIIKLFH